MTSSISSLSPAHAHHVCTLCPCSGVQAHQAAYALPALMLPALMPLALMLPALIIPWPDRTLARSYLGFVLPWPNLTLVRSYVGPIIP